MTSRLTNIITGLLGMGLLMVFVIGLAHSIATGFAGFDGALPFIVIVGFVLCLVLFDFVDQCLRVRSNRPKS